MPGPTAGSNPNISPILANLSSVLANFTGIRRRIKVRGSGCSDSGQLPGRSCSQHTRLVGAFPRNAGSQGQVEEGRGGQPCPSNTQPSRVFGVHLTTSHFITGLQTSQDARFYALSARFEPFSNKGQTLVVQFTVKHEQNIDCGGGYVKLFPSGLDQKDMHGDSEYNIMFGEGAPASADLCRLYSGCRLKPFITGMLIFISWKALG